MGFWYGPQDQQSKSKNFLSLTDTLYVIVSSSKDKGKAFKEHIVKGLAQSGFVARIAEIQEDKLRTVVALKRCVIKLKKWYGQACDKAYRNSKKKHQNPQNLSKWIERAEMIIVKKKRC